MAITAGQLKMYLTGGAANADPNASLGGVTSSVLFVTNTLQNLFANVGPAEGLAGSTKYRALAFKNTSAETAYGAVVYLIETSSADTTIEIAYDPTGTQSVADEDTAPVGLSFSTPLSLATGISLGDIVAGGQARIWLKRIVSASAAAVSADSGTITVTVGSGP